MSPVNKTQLLRVVDANLNRAKEGLRVCEDVCRFVLNDAALTRGFKDVRHRLTGLLSTKKLFEALKARKIESDVGRGTTASEASRQNFRDVFWANSQRVKESVRVLEECLKMMDEKGSRECKTIRYRIYALEQRTLARF